MDFALKVALIFVASLILWGLLVYGCIAYVQVEANPLLWPEDCRVDHAVITFIVSTFCTACCAAALAAADTKGLSW